MRWYTFSIEHTGGKIKEEQRLQKYFKKIYDDLKRPDELTLFQSKLSNIKKVYFISIPDHLVSLKNLFLAVFNLIPCNAPDPNSLQYIEGDRQEFDAS